MPASATLRSLARMALRNEPIFNASHRGVVPKLNIPCAPAKPIRFSDMENVTSVGPMNDLFILYERTDASVSEQVLEVRDSFGNALRICAEKTEGVIDPVVAVGFGDMVMALDRNARDAVREFLRLVDGE